jgi:ABC-type multidrug transport system ATPase subunit
MCQATHVPARSTLAYHRQVQAVLSAESVRIDVGGVPTVDGLSFSTTGERVLVLGAASALFEASGGMRAVARGELRVEGMAPLAAIRAGIAACAPRDPPMPPSWTVRQYATWSARLAGNARATAEALAEDALARLKLSSLTKTKLAGASLALRRATVVAAAIATGATTLLVEDPLGGLADDAARTFARAVARGLSDRRSAVFAARVPLDSPVALTADEAIVVDGSHVAARGDPAEIASDERTFTLRVGGDVGAFANAIRAHGAKLLAPATASIPARVSVHLGTLGTRDLLRIAQASNAIVLELRPIARAFA